ncbi:hypothetical protein [Nocardia sp. NPDC052566]|uniref:hypothetical protein n=1 Tax=Nocardia sp. NPDC052566 TaxID=3364330 RepID=UPI0037C9B758
MTTAEPAICHYLNCTNPAIGFEWGTLSQPRRKMPICADCRRRTRRNERIARAAGY